jgi:hypothetical protein
MMTKSQQSVIEEAARTAAALGLQRENLHKALEREIEPWLLATHPDAMDVYLALPEASRARLECVESVEAILFNRGYVERLNRHWARVHVRELREHLAIALGREAAA